MSQDDNTRAAGNADGHAEQPQPTMSASPVHDATSAAEGAVVADANADAGAPTIGTGTSIALGCVAGTILLIAIGLIYLAIAALF